ncbi:MAG: GNAT family N-acetyltransferase [Bacteroidota bacterium]
MSKTIKIFNREMTPVELQRMRDGFDEHTIDNGVEVQSADRFSFTAVLGDQFVGCSSGLAYKNKEQYSGWFYLTDLFVEKSYRYQGLGSKLLLDLEAQIQAVGVTDIWVWTAGYEAPPFYQKLGYEIFAEMGNWYSDGSSRVGLKKSLNHFS